MDCTICEGRKVLYESAWDWDGHDCRHCNGTGEDPMQLLHIHHKDCWINGLKPRRNEEESFKLSYLEVYDDTSMDLVILLDASTTECAECKSRTHHERGKSSQLIES